MFEIGSSLRSARERRKLELADVEGATHIRTKYLQALEDERFDVLPGPAYVKGFLRTYADHLGLDGQQFVAEYNARFPAAEAPEAAPLVRVRPRRRLLDARLVVIPVVVAIGLFVWRMGSGGGGPEQAAFVPTAPAHVTASTVKRAPPAPPTAEDGPVRSRRRSRSLLAVGAARIGYGQASLRANARRGSACPLRREPPLAADRRAVERRRDVERKTSRAADGARQYRGHAAGASARRLT